MHFFSLPDVKKPNVFSLDGAILISSDHLHQRKSKLVAQTFSVFIILAGSFQ